MKYFLAIALLLASLCPNAQNKTVHISGCIVDSSGQPVTQAQVRVRLGEAGRLLAFQTLGPRHCFVLQIHTEPSDSVMLFITHPALETKKIAAPPDIDSTWNLTEIVLEKNKNVLPNVTVTTPPMWVRGDTTFFAADYYREGNEKKLKELLLKMPDFEIDASGNLLYKRRLVEKLTIEGEELFADNIKLLVNSLPVHAIQTVQILDNQNNNRLLKGLGNDNHIFLNLGLKKNRMHLAFGDVELGAGTKNRYQIAPSLFSVGKKIKWGYAGNNNNTGEGFDWGEEKNLLPPAIGDAAAGMMNEQTLQLVNNFPSRRYIDNRRLSNHLQINYKLAAGIKASTQVEQLDDRQRQSIYYDRVLLTDTGYLRRSENRTNKQHPAQWRALQKLDWQLGPRHLLRVNLQYYGQRSRTTQQIGVSDITGMLSTLNLISSNKTYAGLDAEWTQRVSERQARRFYFQSGWGDLQQRSTASSDSWHELLDIADSSYRQLTQHFEQQTFFLQTGAEFIRKKTRPTWQHGLHFSSQKKLLDNPVQLSSESATPPLVSIPFLSMSANISGAELYGLSSLTRSAGKLSLSVTSKYGWSWNRVRATNTAKTTSIPLGEIKLALRSPVAAVNSFVVTAAAMQNAFDYVTWSEQIFPQSALWFYKSNMVRGGDQRAEINGLFNHRLRAVSHRGLSSLGWHVTYRRQFRSLAQTPQVRQLLQLAIDTMIRRSTHSFSNALTYFYSLGQQKFRLQATLQHNFLERYTFALGRLQRVQTNWMSFLLVANRRWSGSYNLGFELYHNRFSNRWAGEKTDRSGQTNHTTRMILKQELTALKNHRLQWTTEWYAATAARGQTRALLFIDLKWNYFLPKTRWSLELTLGNIGNEKLYNTFNNELLQQEYFRLPLLRRNLFCSVRYEL